MKRFFFILLFILFLTEISNAQVYKWLDEKGVLHFTDDMMQVPERYRSQIEKMGLPEEKAEKKKEEEPKKKEESYRDRLGRGEAYWKAQVEEWNKKMAEVQARLNGLRTKYNELTEKFNDSKSTVERTNLRKERDYIKAEIDRCKNQIEEAKFMLEKKIPEEAEIFRAKQEWIKQ